MCIVAIIKIERNLVNDGMAELVGNIYWDDIKIEL